MMSRAVYRNHVTLVLTFAALVAGSPALAQEAGADETLARFRIVYRHREQAAAANRLAAQLGPASVDPSALYELSRLLSEPCDQLRWLNGQIELRSPLRTKPETAAAAKAVLARLTELEQAESAALAPCPDQLELLKQHLQETAEPPKPVWELTEPALLVERWRTLHEAEKDELKNELAPDQKLALLSRGIPPGQLGLNQQHAWDQPRRIVDELARSATLPPMWRLLRLERELRAGQREGGVWSGFVFPVDDTFQIAHGLLDRALGVDAYDRGSSARDPDWADVAGRFESLDYWAWAALARILEAGGQEDPAEAVDQAAAQWGKLVEVNQGLNGVLWPAVAQVEQAWLTRLSHRSAPEPPQLLPLRPDYRSALRAERRRFEQQFLQARDDPAEAFRMIQLAKAAGVGLRDFQPIGLRELEESFKTTIRGEVALKVFVLLEMIEVRRGPGQPPQYYAVMLSAKDWRWTGGGYDAAVVGPHETPAQLARSILDPGVELTDQRILIAPDGPLDGEWFVYEKDHLLGRTKDRAKGWLYYLPSAAALKAGTWTLDRTLRFWYVAALHAAQETVGCYPDRGPPWPIRSNLYQSPKMPLHALSVGPLPEEIGELRKSRSFVAQFKDCKTAGSAAEQSPLPVVLVLTSEGP